MNEFLYTQIQKNAVNILISPKRADIQRAGCTKICKNLSKML